MQRTNKIFGPVKFDFFYDPEYVDWKTFLLNFFLYSWESTVYGDRGQRIIGHFTKGILIYNTIFKKRH